MLPVTVKTHLLAYLALGTNARCPASLKFSCLAGASRLLVHHVLRVRGLFWQLCILDFNVAAKMIFKRRCGANMASIQASLWVPYWLACGLLFSKSIYFNGLQICVFDWNVGCCCSLATANNDGAINVMLVAVNEVFVSSEERCHELPAKKKLPIKCS